MKSGLFGPRTLEPTFMGCVLLRPRHIEPLGKRQAFGYLRAIRTEWPIGLREVGKYDPTHLPPR